MFLNSHPNRVFPYKLKDYDVLPPESLKLNPGLYQIILWARLPQPFNLLDATRFRTDTQGKQTEHDNFHCGVATDFSSIPASSDTVNPRSRK